MEEITIHIWRQGKISLIVESASVEEKGDYWRSQFEGGTDLTPPLDKRGIEVRPISGVGTM